MKSGVSTLNPYAASYIPLSKRETNDSLDIDRTAQEDIVARDETVWCLRPAHLTQNQQHSGVSLDSDGHRIENSSSPDVFTQKKTTVQGSFGSLLQTPGDMRDKQMMDDELDMDMEFLQMTFPGLSTQSIADVYLANDGDLEATIDMLNQLEIYSAESLETLPETLDIGDVSEGGSSASTLKLKNVASETCASCASSSGSSDSAVTPD